MANLALFDFDGTISNTDTYTSFIFYSIPKKKLILGFLRIFPHLMLYKLRLLSRHGIREYILRHGYKGLSKNYLYEKGESYSKYFIPKTIKEKALEKILWHKDQGDKVVVVSASYDFYLSKWCKDNGIDLIATKIHFENDTATGQYDGEDCYGVYKVAEIKKHYDLKSFSKVYAYGDTYEDYDMLVLADYQFLNWKEVKL